MFEDVWIMRGVCLTLKYLGDFQGWKVEDIVEQLGTLVPATARGKRIQRQPTAELNPVLLRNRFVIAERVFGTRKLG